MDGRCHLEHSRGRVGESGHSRDIGRRGSTGLWKEKEGKARQGREEPALHFHPLDSGTQLGSASPAVGPPTSGLRLSSPVCFLDLGRGSVSGADTTGTLNLGEDKEKPQREERDPGQEKGPQESDSRKRGGEEEVGGGGGERPGSEGAEEDPLQVSTLPATIPMGSKYCCSPVRPKVETVSAHNPWEGARLFCYASLCPMKGPWAKVRGGSLVEGGGLV